MNLAVRTPPPVRVISRTSTVVRELRTSTVRPALVASTMYSRAAPAPASTRTSTKSPFATLFLCPNSGHSNSSRARYRAMRPGWETSGDQLEAILRAYVTRDSRVLDLGCGRGGVMELFWRDVKLAAGLDPDVSSLAEHRAPGIPVVRGRGEHLPFADGSFDLVVCLWVLEHLERPEVVFREVRRALRPGGHFVFL